MGVLAALYQHLGLALFTALSIVLVVYLAYSMVHPERF